MNERIKELMEYAVRFRLDPDSNTHEALVQPEDLELFAELIVRECMSMCDVAQVGYLTHGHTLQGEGCQGAKQYISDWFEVEE